MTRTLILAALAATLAAPVAAQQVSNPQAHFNMDFDSALENVRGTPSPDSFTTVSTRSNSNRENAFIQFNAQEDSIADFRGLRGATLYANRPSRGLDAFASIRAESLEDED